MVGGEQALCRGFYAGLQWGFGPPPGVLRRLAIMFHGYLAVWP
jgi:hypothetical protein